MRRRIVASTAAVVVAAVLAFSAPLAIVIGALLETRALDEVQGTVEQLGLVLDVTSRNCNELQLRVAQLVDSPLELTVVASGPRVVATSVPSGRVTLGSELEATTEGRVGRRASAGSLAVAAPLSTTVCATPMALVASRDDTELRAETRRSWTIVAVGALVVAALGTASAWAVGRTLSRPFEALAGPARRLGEGDFSARAPRSGLAEADAIAEALDRTATRLDRALARSAAFTADASHQLRTPLTALRLQLETLEAATAGERDRETLAAALAEADRLEATIEELLALTRIDAPEVEIDPSALVAEQLDAWRALAREHGRELVDDLAPVPAVRVRPAALVQALQVLFDNALEHGSGRVTVSVRTSRAHRLDPDGPPPLPADGPPALPAGGPALPADELPLPAGGEGVSVCVRDEGPGPAAIGHRDGGRGLPLAEALVTAEGGHLTFGRTDDGGTAACLVLPASRP